MRTRAGSPTDLTPRGRLFPAALPPLPAAGLALGGAALWCGPGLAVHWPPVARALGVPLALPAGRGVALTFDDGPHPEGTPAVLEVLRAQDARATFFLIGEQVERYPALAQRIVTEGHEVAVHGYRHRNQMRLSPRTFTADLEHALEVISRVCGARPSHYRPPYGVFTLVGLAAVRRRGLIPLLWSKWGRDWRARWPAEKITALATSGMRSGDVVLLHDADWYSSSGSHRNTAAALPEILGEVNRRGLTPVTVSETP